MGKDETQFDVDGHEFLIPKKQAGPPPEIIPNWEKSQAYQDLVGFILAMNNAVKGKKSSADCTLSPVNIGVFPFFLSVSSI